MASGIKEGCGDTSNCNALNSSHANYTQHQNSSYMTDDNYESSFDYQVTNQQRECHQNLNLLIINLKALNFWIFLPRIFFHLFYYTNLFNFIAIISHF